MKGFACIAANAEGFAAGVVLVFRPPTAATEKCCLVEVTNQSSKLFVQPEPQPGFAIS
jgi:hypothetical protein